MDENFPSKMMEYLTLTKKQIFNLCNYDEDWTCYDSSERLKPWKIPHAKKRDNQGEPINTSNRENAEEVNFVDTVKKFGVKKFIQNLKQIFTFDKTNPTADYSWAIGMAVPFDIISEVQTLICDQDTEEEIPDNCYDPTMERVYQREMEEG